MSRLTEKQQKRALIYASIKAVLSLGAGILVYFTLEADLSLVFIIPVLMAYAVIVAIAINAAHNWYDEP